VIRLTAMLSVGFPRPLRNVEDLSQEGGAGGGPETVRLCRSRLAPKMSFSLILRSLVDEEST